MGTDVSDVIFVGLLVADDVKVVFVAFPYGGVKVGNLEDSELLSEVGIEEVLLVISLEDMLDEVVTSL